MTAARGTTDRFAKGLRYLVFGLGAALLTLTVSIPAGRSAGSASLTGVDLSKYVRVGRFDLPEPTRTPAPPNSLLAQEASSVTYDWDTDTLFVVGDGGTSVVQVTKTGQLIDSMTLRARLEPAGHGVLRHRGHHLRRRRPVRDDGGARPPGRPLHVRPRRHAHARGVQTVKLGTTIGNVGLEGVANDPITGGLILVKEKTPESIFQTGIDWAAGTATNGSPTTDESVEPLRSRPRRDRRLLRRVRARERLDADRPRREPPADHQPGVREDRQRRPLGQRVEHAHDPVRPGQPALRRRPDARGRDDGQRRHDLHRQRGRRRRHQPPAALGVQADGRPQPAADRRAAEQRRLVDRREHEHARRASRSPTSRCSTTASARTTSPSRAPMPRSSRSTGGSLFIKPGTVLDFETKPVYNDHGERGRPGRRRERRTPRRRTRSTSPTS